MTSIGCIGLGHLGFALAENLIGRGFSVHGFRRGSLAQFEAMGGRAARSPKDLAERSDVVITCLPSADALIGVFCGPDGLLQGLRPGQIVIDVTTASIPVKESLRKEVEDHGGRLLDAPISGRPADVKQRKAIVLVSGDRNCADNIRHVLDALSGHHPYCGPFGNGTRLKFIANMLLTVHTLAAAEAAHLAGRAGIGPELLLEALSGSSVVSDVFRSRLPVLATERPGPGAASSKMMLQDLHAFRSFAEGLHAPMPLFSTALACFEQAVEGGHGDQDTVLIFTHILREMAASAGTDQSSWNVPAA